MTAEGLRGLLESFGYELRFRQHEWVECFLYAEGESWTGRGPDPAAALDDAIAKACPSALAQGLLQRAVAEERPAPRPPAENGRSPRSSPPVLVPRSGLPSPDRPRSLEELAILEQRIRDTRDELGLCSAERQRLAIYAFICEARGHTDLFPDDGAIRDQIAVISRLLTEIGKAFWPGSVTALQLHIEPRDLPRHILGGVATTWTRAAELADRALASLEHADDRRGYDPYGWADPPEQRPTPADADARLSALFDEIARKSGSLERQAEPKQTGWRPEPEQFLEWIRTLRSVRGAGVDPERWARVAGRLRWWAGRRDPKLASAARELEASFVPEQGWVQGVEPPEVLRVELPEELVHRVRDAFGNKRMVVVSRRRDPDLEARVAGALGGAELEWRMAEPKRLEALDTAIAGGRFDVVLSALGFSARDADHRLARSCKDAGVRYVRVNRGRPLTCLRALARSLR